MEALVNDLRYSYRILLKRPSFAVIAVMTLALGIGACTAIFSIVDAVLLRSLPYPESDRIVQFREINEKGSQMAVAEPNFLDVRERSRSLEAAAQYSGGLVTVTGGSEPVRARTLTASADFFRVLGVQPLVGRTFSTEDRAGDAPVAVVSYGFWQRLLGGRASLDNTVLRIDDKSLTVIGVMPQGFDFPQSTEIWIPREIFTPQTSRSGHNWSVVARLRPGATVEQAVAEVSAIHRELKQEHGKDMDAIDFTLIPLQEYLVGNVRTVLVIILVAVAVLLLVACTNVANLLLAQVTARHREFAVRTALGATRLRLARQFITENVVLALAAGLLGVLLSYWGVDLLVSLNQNALPRASEIGVDTRALVFTFGLSLAIAVALGLVPVARFSSIDLQTGLKESGRGTTAAGARRLRSLLVISQMALTLILLINAGLLGKSFYRLLQNDPGFRPESAVVMDLSLPRYDRGPEEMKRVMANLKALQEGKPVPESELARPDQDERQRQTARAKQQILERLNQIPGVIAVGSINTFPLRGGGSSGTFLIDNDPAKTGSADYRVTSPGYFAAMGIPLLRGRLFDQSDRSDSPPVAVISQVFAERYWPNENPIGKRIQFGNMDGDMRLIEIVGIVGDVRDRGLEANPGATLYAYDLQRPQSSSMAVVVRAQADPMSLVPLMRQAVQSINSELPTSFRTIEQIFSASLDTRRFSLVIFGVFASVALILAIMGIYGVMSYTVTQNTHEIGIRMALGAQRRDVLKLVVGQGLVLSTIGIGIGVVAAFGVTRLVSSLLYGVSATDLTTFLVISLVLASAALVASYVPARRATRVDPMIALREE